MAIAEHGEQIKAIILNYPANPTGVTYSQAELQALAAVLGNTDILVLSDEIYSVLTYEGEHTSFASLLPEQTILLNGVSKSHAMTGYRIGYLAGPADLMKKIILMHALMTTAVSNPAMAAATEALGTDEGFRDSERMRAEYDERRHFVVRRLQEIGFTVPNPQGAFYVFAKIPADQAQDSVQFALTLAEQAKVAVIPGSAFGQGGQGYIRISYAASMTDLTKALDQIETFINQ